MTKFSSRLRELRNSKNLSQQKLADLVGTSKSSINMYERGEREPGLEMLVTFADFYNVDLDYLLGKSDIPNRKHVCLNHKRKDGGIMEITYSKQAIKFLKKQSITIRKRIVNAINNLPQGDIKKYQGTISKYRLRVGDYRVIFDKQGNILYIEKIGARGDVYK